MITLSFQLFVLRLYGHLNICNTKKLPDSFKVLAGYQPIFFIIDGCPEIKLFCLYMLCFWVGEKGWASITASSTSLWLATTILSSQQMKFNFYIAGVVTATFSIMKTVPPFVTANTFCKRISPGTARGMG